MLKRSSSVVDFQLEDENDLSGDENNEKDDINDKSDDIHDDDSMSDG